MTVEVKKFSSNKNTDHQSKQNFYLKNKIKNKKLRIPTKNFVVVNFFSSLLQQQNSTGIVLCISSFTQPVPTP